MTVAKPRRFARIHKACVAEIFDMPPSHAHLEIHEIFGGQHWVEVTHVADPVEQGHRYDATTGEFSRPIVPMPSPEQEALQVLRTGMSVVSRLNPALDGTYPLSQDKMRYVAAIMQRLEMGRGFPGGRETIAWKATNGVPHEMTRDEFRRFATAMSDVLFELMSVAHEHSTALPRMPVCIDPAPAESMATGTA